MANGKKHDFNPNYDDYILPIGHADIKGKKLKDTPLARLDAFLGWLEARKAYPDLQRVLVKYLEDNKYDA